MPRVGNTKELILDAALELFSQRGYDGVGLREIAARVGIRESALYKHFAGKQELFDALVERMYDEYNIVAGNLNADSEAEGMIDKYTTISESELLQISYGFFLYFAKDERAAKFRKILTMEQYRNERIGSLYKALYFENVLTYHSIIFKGLIEAGIMIDADPDIVALHFYSPVFLLLTSYDERKITEAEAMNKLTDHVRQFRKIYNREGK